MRTIGRDRRDRVTIEVILLDVDFQINEDSIEKFL